MPKNLRASPPPNSAENIPKLAEELNERQRAFAEAMVDGAKSATEAARIAGYEAPSATGRTLMQNVKVLRYLQALVLARTAEVAAAAPQVLLDLMTSPRVSARVRADIANAALDRVGARAPERIEVNGASKLVIDLGDGDAS